MHNSIFQIQIHHWTFQSHLDSCKWADTLSAVWLCLGIGNESAAHVRSSEENDSVSLCKWEMRTSLSLCSWGNSMQVGDEDLEPSNVYVMFHMHRVISMVVAADMGPPHPPATGLKCCQGCSAAGADGAEGERGRWRGGWVGGLGTGWACADRGGRGWRRSRRRAVLILEKRNGVILFFFPLIYVWTSMSWILSE